MFARNHNQFCCRELGAVRWRYSCQVYTIFKCEIYRQYVAITCNNGQPWIFNIHELEEAINTEIKANAPIEIVASYNSMVDLINKDELR